MWCWIELVMALFNRLGTRTCRTSPTKEATSEVMKIPLWAPMMGMTRRSQVRDLSGSMVARGASLRATSAMGTKSVPVSGVVGRTGSEPGSPHRLASGPAGRPRRRSAMPPGRRRPAPTRSGSSRHAAISPSRSATAASAGRGPGDRCRSGRGPPVGGRRPHAAARPGPGPPGRRRWRSRWADARPGARPGRRRRPSARRAGPGPGTGARRDRRWPGRSRPAWPARPRPCRWSGV